MRLALPSVMTAIPSVTCVVRTSAFIGSPPFSYKCSTTHQHPAADNRNRAAGDGFAIFRNDHAGQRFEPFSCMKSIFDNPAGETELRGEGKSTAGKRRWPQGSYMRRTQNIPHLWR